MRCGFLCTEEHYDAFTLLLSFYNFLSGKQESSSLFNYELTRTCGSYRTIWPSRDDGGMVISTRRC